MTKAGTYRNSPRQLSLWAEGDADTQPGLGAGSPVVRGEDVFLKPNGRVRQEWLTACREERALTQDVMHRVADASNLAAALRQVVQNGGSPGIDGMTVSELRDWFQEHWPCLGADLLAGRYEPEGVRGVSIPKPSGGTRQLGIPTCKDRLVQQAISQVLTGRYERVFSAHSYGFRVGRSAHQALDQAAEYVRQGYHHVIDLDLEQFFDTVCHDRLMWLLGTRIGDKRLLRLVG